MLFLVREKSKLHNKIVAAVAAAVTVVGLAGCAPQEDAGEETSIVVYAGRDEALVQPLIDQFTAETGIEVEVRYAGSAELAAQLLEEGENSPANIFFAQDAGALGAVSKAGLLSELPSEIYGLVPERYSAKDRTWIGVSGRVRVMVYDPEKVTEIPASVFDLADPAWQGRIAIAPTNASFQAFVTAMRTVYGDDAALEWLRAMKQNAVVYEKNGAILEAVEAGQVDAGLINHYYWHKRALEQENRSLLAQFEGSDIGNLVNAAGVGIVNDSPAARDFVAYLLSPTGQQYFAEETREYPLVRGLEPADELTPLSQIPAPEFDLNDLNALEQTLDLIRAAGLI